MYKEEQREASDKLFIIVDIGQSQMSVAADVTAQSIEGQNEPKNDSSSILPPTQRKSHIREHPFMKEVSSYYILSFY